MGYRNVLVAACLSLTSSVIASPYYPLFEYPLPIPPIASPAKTVNVEGQNIDYYDVTIEPFSKQIYHNLGATNLVGYNGISPGPTYIIERYQQTVVRYRNNADTNTSVHLHGSDTHAPWDGWADDMMLPGQFKDYFYPNDHMARSIWYHDHADHVTGANAYSGLGGIWIIHDPQEDSLGLPSGDYDVPLAIVDRTYDNNGALVVPTTEGVNQFGDVIEVNSQPWPYLSVEPRKYRLRIFIMSLSRPFTLFIADDSGNWIDYTVIASDCGLFASPVTSNNLQIAPGERYEIVFDFSPYSGQNLTMGNSMGTGPAGEIPEYFHGQKNSGVNAGNTSLVMQFNVGSSVSDSSNNGDVPQTLSPGVQWPSQTTEVAQTFDFGVGGDARWTINGVSYDDPTNRVLARPQQGTTELWQVNYAGGPGVHPVHVHLVSFQIVERTGGSRGLLPYESAGLKDIVLLEPGESAKILANYGPWNGLYMFHCHNLIHEDNAMMAVINITAVEGLGYNATEDFADPGDARFVARYVQDNSYDDDQISSTISYLGQLHAYDSTWAGSTPTAAPTNYAPTVSSNYYVPTSTEITDTSYATTTYAPQRDDPNYEHAHTQHWQQAQRQHHGQGRPEQTHEAKREVGEEVAATKTVVEVRQTTFAA